MANQSSALLTLDNISVTYGVDDKKSSKRHLAVADINVSIQTGEKFVIIGPSGCGKSTLLKAVGGFLRPSRGMLTLRGTAVTGPAPNRTVVFQEFDQLLPWKTVRENIAFALRRTSTMDGETIAARVIEFIGLVGLSERIDVYPHQLSGGQKQRVAIARSLAIDPDVLLMDEPFGALDAQTRMRMQEELNNIWRKVGTTLLFVTHDIHEAVFLGHRILVLAGSPGRVHAILENQFEGQSGESVALSDFVKELRQMLVPTALPNVPVGGTNGS